MDEVGNVGADGLARVGRGPKFRLGAQVGPAGSANGWAMRRTGGAASATRRGAGASNTGGGAGASKSGPGGAGASNTGAGASNPGRGCFEDGRGLTVGPRIPPGAREANGYERRHRFARQRRNHDRRG